MTGHSLRFWSKRVDGTPYVTFIAECIPCDNWRQELDGGHDLADLISLYVQHAGLDAAKTLCIDTLAKIAPATDPQFPELAAAAVRGEPYCGVRGPSGRYTCAAPPGHGGDHVAWGSEVGDGRPVTWPQPAVDPLACGRCGSADHDMDPVTDSRVPGGVKNECHDLHDCGERAAQQVVVTLVEATPQRIVDAIRATEAARPPYTGSL